MEELDKLPFSSIAGALQYQSNIRPDKRAILYPDPDRNFNEYASLTYKEYDNITNELAERISSCFPSCSNDETITCATLAVGGIEYLLSQYALLKLSNVIMFPISARNSRAAIEHLLRESRTNILLTTSQFAPMIETIQKEQKQFQSLIVLLLESEQLQIGELLKNKTIQYPIKSNRIELRKKNSEELNRVVVILHRFRFSFI